MTNDDYLTPDQVKNLTLTDQSVLIAFIGGRFSFEYVSIDVARYLVGQGVARTLTEEGRTLIAKVTKECKNCGHPVVWVEEDDHFIHSTPDGVPLPMGRGCRAASFSRDGDWDDSMDKASKATA